MKRISTKKRLVNILEKLELVQLKSEEKMDFSMSKVAHVDIKDCDSIVVRAIKEKLNDNNGRAIIRFYQGDICAIWFDENSHQRYRQRISLYGK